MFIEVYIYCCDCVGLVQELSHSVKTKEACRQSPIDKGTLTSLQTEIEPLGTPTRRPIPTFITPLLTCKSVFPLELTPSCCRTTEG